ncbi:energy-coupling factor transporter ATPase [Limosilactobacillus sp.]|uniref:energy-coupling factor transporter ATPase n=1 Tax=Limosilactobacillus sp. TaxID=2773925 RepID=UPI0025C43AC4|nr:energy-coupling factor transporter ATPase [Limosilactobacillus sp.]MCH3921231.1 energy-coupling factor transporter ATPase [Limosilactobacillus sp.]MCH3928002.1 energy-coupling factor transporter ATPase [Limosilactobacillus sp.]
MNAVTLTDIQYQYPDAQQPVLDGISLAFPAGQWTALIGRNGSGKSTMARLIDGLLVPQRGQIKVGDLAVTEDNLTKVHQRVGIVFQNPDNQFVGATVADDVAFGLENRQVPREEMPSRIQRALEAVDMAGLSESEPTMLSGGQKQRVALAGILALRPQVIILDEATSMLDPAGRQLVLSLLERLRDQQQFTIISITHDPAEMAMADQLVVLDQGKIARQGTTAEVLRDVDLLEKIGVGIPAGQQLRQELADRGVAVPDRYFTVEEMVKWLSQQL